jgi:hypothetical protein
MPTNTYVELRKETVAVATNTVTFDLTGISGYTDLVLVTSGTVNSGSYFTLRFNSDTGSNYSETSISGDGSTAGSFRNANQTYMLIGGIRTTQTTITTHIMNYSNSTTNKTAISRSSNSAVEAAFTAGLWRNTASITSIQCGTGGANTFSVGTTISLYGIKAQPAYTIKATGGNISYGADGYVYHSFLSDGNFVPTQSLSCDVLVVAGGGGSGYGANAGGGGAGGYLQGTMNLTATTYPVVIGNGGTTSYPSEGLGGAGGNTTFNGATALGGGAGSGNSNVNGSNGGSGGGGGYNPPTIGTGGSATQGNSGGLTGFGNAGGTGGTIRSGGGAGSAGGDPNNGAFGAGKVWLNGVTYASGGNRLTSGPATPAVPNSGRGGDQGSVGSSGIVIVRYLG